MLKSKLYFECHVTIEPVFDEDLEKVSKIGRLYGFRTADLLMKKRSNDTEERSKYDTFLTTRNSDYDYIKSNMETMIYHLKQSGFKVWRYKIEDTIVDSKIKDEYELI